MSIGGFGEGAVEVGGKEDEGLEFLVIQEGFENSKENGPVINKLRPNGGS